MEERGSRSDGVWCVLGDFNVVCRREERRGVNEEASSGQLSEMYLFNNFIGEMELEDLKVLGRRFTWYHTNGRSMSRIDRGFISDEWTQAWGESSLWVLPRDVSNHCPLILKHGDYDWGPKPFRFKGKISGWMSFVLKEKLKGIKGEIKEWNKVEYGGMEERMEKLVEEINSIDEKGEEGVLEESEMVSRKLKFEELGRLLKAKYALFV